MQLTKVGQFAQEQGLAHAAGPDHKERLPAGDGEAEALVDGPVADAATQPLDAQLREGGLRVGAGGAHTPGLGPLADGPEVQRPASGSTPGVGQQRCALSPAAGGGGGN